MQEPDINKCPTCGGVADNGHDRCYPPNPYECTKCAMTHNEQDVERVARAIQEAQENDAECTQTPDVYTLQVSAKAALSAMPTQVKQPLSEDDIVAILEPIMLHNLGNIKGELLQSGIVLRDVKGIAQLQARALLPHLSAQGCPHAHTSTEGTSYCDLAESTVRDYEEVLADKRRLTRLLDVALCGEEGAAKQASLCDLIPIAKRLKQERDDIEQAAKGLREALETCIPHMHKLSGKKYATKEKVDYHYLREALAQYDALVKGKK